ncbi:MAG: formate/nitrite transporter family protein [Actinobacteria bacterium]|nr:formate/nitrite transporter family protein [Actinomycetota bacterium]
MRSVTSAPGQGVRADNRSRGTSVRLRTATAARRTGGTVTDALGITFKDTVAEGSQRLARTWPALLATGFVGGIDVSIGLLGMLLVKHHTGSDLLAAVVFSAGFIALTLANSELFTENFLVPVVAVAADKGTLAQVLRLWGGTAVTNLLGGCLMVFIMITAEPELGETGVELGATFIERGVSMEAFASAVLAGVVITLMTWMQHGTRSVFGKLTAAIVAAFLLAYGHLSHVIVASLEVFAGILGGADTGYLDWAGQFLLWAAGNAVGGLGLVTVLRLVQVGPKRLQREQEREVPIEEDAEPDADPGGGDEDPPSNDGDTGDDGDTERNETE